MLEFRLKLNSAMGDRLIVRKARQPHKCAGRYSGENWVDCPVIIERGQTYIEYKGELLLYKTQMRYHLECAMQLGLIQRQGDLCTELDNRVTRQS
jgi:hypothetical protein